MNARHGMTCETCRDLLMELVCDELPSDTAQAARAHALTCERCGPELNKLEALLQVSRNLPQMDPSPGVERRIMQAARDAIADHAKGPAREASSAPSGTWTAWFTKLGAWAMSPQVAMASVLMLVVGIGLYALPLGRDPAPTALRESEEDEVASVATPAATATSAPTPAEVAQEPAPADTVEQRQGSVPEAKGAPGKRSATQLEKQAPAKAQKSAGGAAYDALEDSLVGSGRMDSDRSAPARLRERSAPAAASQGSAGNDVGTSAFAPPPPQAAPAPASSALARREYAKAVESTAPAGKDESSGLSDGIAAAQRGDYVEAKKRLLPLTSSHVGATRAQATLWVARSLRAEGNCSAALPYYRVLTQATTAARAVLEETADCLERTGNAAQAAKLRARAGGSVKSPKP